MFFLKSPSPVNISSSQILINNFPEHLFYLTVNTCLSPFNQLRILSSIHPHAHIALTSIPIYRFYREENTILSSLLPNRMSRYLARRKNNKDSEQYRVNLLANLIHFNLSLLKSFQILCTHEERCYSWNPISTVPDILQACVQFYSITFHSKLHYDICIADRPSFAILLTCPISISPKEVFSPTSPRGRFSFLN